MRKIIAFMHISLDGFVAGPNGEMNWIKINDEIFSHVGERVAKCDSAMYGRNTYQMMENYWPGAGTRPGATKHDIEHSKWYLDARKFVLSRTLSSEGSENVTVIADDLAKNIQEIKLQDGPEFLVFGSPGATHSLLQENLIDGYWLFVNPIVLGQGIPLFKNIKEKTELNLLSSHVFQCGVVELRYAVAGR